MPTDEQTITRQLDDNEFEFPIGHRDEKGTLHKTFKLGEMTGEIDEKINDEKVAKNGGKLVTELVAGVVESVGDLKKFKKDDARNLFTADRDMVALMNYKYSIDDVIEWESQCPRCGENNDISLNVDDVAVTYLDEHEKTTFTVELPKGVKDAEGNVYKNITMRYPDGNSQESMGKLKTKNMAEIETSMLATLTEDIEGFPNWNYNTFKKMTKKDRRFLSETISKLDAGVDLYPYVTCSNYECENEYRTPIPVRTLLGE